MLAKLAFRNVRRSGRDFAVYFVTLVLGVCVFYAFNSLSSQSVLFDLQMAASDKAWYLVDRMMGLFSVAVALVLGFLVVYANSYLMKRRKKEFGTYLLLGMRPGQVSAIVLMETLIVGLFALVVGLFLGFLLSQGMAFFSSSLLGLVMKEYHFVFSLSALLFTVLAFALMFALVAVLNVIQVRRCKLVSLFSARQQREVPKQRNVVVSVLGFVTSLVVLGLAYFALNENGLIEIDREFVVATVLMIVGTGLFFWSVAGMVTGVLQRFSGIYWRGLTAFTFRQLSTRFNGACATLSVVCVLLFLALTTFSTGVGLASMFTEGVKEGTQFDDTITLYPSDYSVKGIPDELKDPIGTLAADSKNWQAVVGSAAALHVFSTDIELESVVNKLPEGVTSAQVLEGMRGYCFQAVGESEFNELRRLCGREPISVGSTGYAVTNTVVGMQSIADAMVSSDAELSLGGVKLRPVAEPVSQGLSVSAVGQDSCVLVVPDSVAAKLAKEGFSQGVKVNIKFADPDVSSDLVQKMNDEIAYGSQESYGAYCLTAAEISEQAVTIRFLVTYLAIYIGFVLLMATAAILSIQQLSSASDSQMRYRTLAQLGCGKRRLFGSLRTQTLVYFLAPLGLACCHWACAFKVLQSNLFTFMGAINLSPVLLAGALVLVVYGIYLLVSYYGSRSIIVQATGKRLLR